MIENGTVLGHCSFMHTKRIETEWFPTSCSETQIILSKIETTALEGIPDSRVSSGAIEDQCFHLSPSP